MRIIVIIFSALFLFLSCNKDSKLSVNNDLQDSLIGNWIPITEINSNEVFIDIFPEIGYSFSKDSIEFYNGLYDLKRDKEGFKIGKNYLGNFKKYKIEGNQLYTQNIKTKKWEEFWEILKIKNDTLFLISNDKSSNKLKRLKYNEAYKNDFDKIIYSSSSCYGTCPILDISLDIKGNIDFQGQAYINLIGFYTGKLNQKTTNYIFKKFQKANILTLESEYTAYYTDSQTITTTFLKNGKIVKSVRDYGRKAPNELIWAYVPMGNISSLTKLTKPKNNQDFPNLIFWDFSIGKKKLILEESEGFFLWTELRKSIQTKDNFIPEYEITYNFYNYSDNDSQTKIPEKAIKKITSDGRYYKIEFLKDKTITYDLGYNFIDRNFKKSDIKEVEEYKSPDL